MSIVYMNWHVCQYYTTIHELCQNRRNPAIQPRNQCYAPPQNFQKSVVAGYTVSIMPVFGLVQALLSRILVGAIALLTAIGLGSVTEAPRSHTPEEPAAAQTEVQLPEHSDFPNPSPLLPETLPAETDEPDPVAPKEEEPVAEQQPVKETVEEIADILIPPLFEIPEDKPSFSQINTDTIQALVNVFCTQTVAGAINSTTGSGVIIDPRGVVLTNAHVAQSLLLKDYPSKDAISCVLRTGSPARNMYTAELLYISPAWVRANAQEIVKDEPKGTGENDFALLRITGRTDPQTSLPETFPFVSPDVADTGIATGDFVLAAAYPAGFLEGESIQKQLFTVSSIAIIGERFTFLLDTIDLFSIGGTVVSQGGSSGGAVVSDENKLIGIVVTSSKAATTAERDLRAITLGHINRSLIQHEGISLSSLLSGDIELKAKVFDENTAPALTTLLRAALEK